MEHTGDIDLKAGFPVAELAEGGIISGRVDGEEAILVRRGKDYFAVVGGHARTTTARLPKD